jgi:membrane-bound acyltransferase YfiQ involved in biofilm formation
MQFVVLMSYLFLIIEEEFSPPHWLFYLCIYNYNKLLNYKQKYNIMNKIITLSIATMFLATSYASHSQNIEHQSPHHKIHWGYKGAIGPSHWFILFSLGV